MGCMHGSKSGRCRHGCGVSRRFRDRIPPANEQEEEEANPCPECPHDLIYHDPLSCNAGECQCRYWPPLFPEEGTQ